MNRWFGVFALLPVIGLFPTAILAPSSAVAGTPCDSRPGGSEGRAAFAVVTDGELLEEAALAEPPRDIVHLEIVCWDTAEEWLGIQVSNAAVIIHTKRGPSGKTESSLRDLVKAQEKYRERNGAYTDDLLSLDSYAPPAGTFVYLTLTENGWTARTEVSSLHQVCHVFVGTRPDIWVPRGGVSDAWFSEGDPVCL